MNGWWDEENNHLVELLGLLYRSNVEDKARDQVTITLLSQHRELKVMRILARSEGLDLALTE